jgi:hypothetical protein
MHIRVETQLIEGIERVRMIAAFSLMVSGTHALQSRSQAILPAGLVLLELTTAEMVDVIRTAVGAAMRMN